MPHAEAAHAGPSRRQVRVLRVFTDEKGRFGNPLGVVDGDLVAPDHRQATAHTLGYSETIFIDDPSSGVLRIFTPGAELPLAGHPLVGAAWVLGASRREGERLLLRPPGGVVAAWDDDAGRTWIEAPLATLPDWTLVELDSPRTVEELTGPLRPEHALVVYFATVAPGLLRSRCFAPSLGIVEDEATGSAALRISALLGRPVEIRQGRGSLLFARPIDAERGAVGGFVSEDDPLPLPG